MPSSSLVFAGPATAVLQTRGQKVPLGKISAAALLAIAQTATLVNGSDSVGLSAPNAAVVAGVQVQFANQPGVTYVVEAVGGGGSTLTLTEPFTGASAAGVAVTNVTPVCIMPATPGNTDATKARQYTFVTLSGERIQLSATPWGTFPGVNGNPGSSFAITTAALGVYDCVGADSQPVQFAAVPASSLTF